MWYCTNILVNIVILWSAYIQVEARGNTYEPRFYDCDDGKRIEFEQFCDGKNDCTAGEDDLPSSNLTSSFDPMSKWHSCFNSKNAYAGSCLVEREQICNGYIACSNISPCDLKCSSHYKCLDGSCFLRTTICNQDPCSGCVEDHGWTNGAGFKCSRNGLECVLPQQLLHDDVKDCDGGADICFRNLTASSRNERQPSENLLRENCFQCFDGSMIIASSNVCDGVIDCPDLSDECSCASNPPEICTQIITTNTIQSEAILTAPDFHNNETMSNVTKCKIGDVRCKSGKCIERKSVCDGVKNCSEDESFDICRGTIACKDSIKREKCRCTMHETDRQASCRRYTGTACDGAADCPPEQAHGWEIFSYWDFPEDECIATCSEHPTYFHCNQTLPKQFKKTLFGTWCEIPDDIVIPEVYTRDIEGSLYCDGVVDCELSGSDEKYCVNDYSRFYCNASREGYISIEDDQVCDGILDCNDGLDELVSTCKDKKISQRFTCPVLGGKMVSIDIKNRCDFISNCDDRSDELNCTEDGRFYCENKEPLFVRKHQVKDGFGDCTDWSDECPTINQSTSTDAFSSRYEMIQNTLLRTLVWLMGFLAIVGNIAVILHEFYKLRRLKKNATPAIRANRLLILNLAVADLLMGIYLLALAVMTIKTRGSYCSQDLAWRSSSTCIGLGALSVISSETSVVTMVLLTGCRLYAVLRPLQSSVHPSYRRVIFLISSSWITSLLLALLPLTSQLTHVFISGVKFNYNPFTTGVSVSLETAKDVFEKIGLIGPANHSNQIDLDLDSFLKGASWADLEEKAPQLFPMNYFEPATYWGYYSAASVCIPKFFTTTSDPAWVFSFVINLFNFVSFTFVATSYIAIYLKSKGQVSLRAGQKGEEKQMKSMQRKILRLIITDFCCWIPICIIAFLKLGGVYISDTAYAVAAIVLLPLNSALNPMMYSDMVDAIYKKCKPKKESPTSHRTTHSTCSSKSTHFVKIALKNNNSSTPDSTRKMVVEPDKIEEHETEL